MSEYLDAACYLPHSAPMVLVDEVIHIDDERARCRVVVSRDGILSPFLTAQGDLPAWFGIEIIAQTIGVWSGWHGRQRSGQHERDAKPRPGMLLGGRGYHCQRDIFPAGSLLDVTVTLLMRDEKVGSFEGEITIGGETYASGRINTYQPDENELKILLEQGKRL